MFRRIAEQTGDFIYSINVTPTNNTNSFDFGFSGSGGLNFSYNFNNGKITDSDGNFLSHYQEDTTVRISGNAFTGYSNSFINGNLKTNSLTRQNISLDKFFFDNSNADYELFFYGDENDFTLSGTDFVDNNETGSLTISNSSDRYFTVFSGNIIFSGEDKNLEEPLIISSYQTITGNSSKEFQFLFPIDLNTGEYSTSAEIYTDYGIINKPLTFDSLLTLTLDVNLSYNNFFDNTGQNLFSFDYVHRRGLTATNDVSNLYISLEKTGGPSNLKELEIAGLSIDTGFQLVNFSGYLNGSGNITGNIDTNLSGYNSYLLGVDSGSTILKYITGTEFLTGNYAVSYDLLSTGIGSGDVNIAFSRTGHFTGGTFSGTGYITGSGQLSRYENFETSGYWGTYRNLYTGIESHEVFSDFIFADNQINYYYTGNATGYYTGSINSLNEFTLYSTYYNDQEGVLTGRNDSYIGLECVSNVDGFTDFRKLVSHTSGFYGFAENAEGDTTGINNLVGGFHDSGFLYFSGYIQSDHKFWLFGEISGEEYFGYSITGYPLISKNKSNHTIDYREVSEMIPNSARLVNNTDITIYSAIGQDQKTTGIDFIHSGILGGLSGFMPISNIGRKNLYYYKELFSGSNNSLIDQPNNVCWLKYSSFFDDTIYLKCFDRMDYDKKTNSLRSSADDDFNIYASYYLLSGSGNDQIISGLLGSNRLDSDSDRLSMSISMGQNYAISLSTNSTNDTGFFNIQYRESTTQARLDKSFEILYNTISPTFKFTGISTELIDDQNISGNNLSNKISEYIYYNLFTEKQNSNFYSQKTTGTNFTGFEQANPISGYNNFTGIVTGSQYGIEKDILIDPIIYSGYKSGKISFSNIFNASDSKMRVLIESISGDYIVIDLNINYRVPGIDFPNFDSGAYIENFNDVYTGYGFTGFEDNGDFVIKYNNYLNGGIGYNYNYSSTFFLSDNYSESGIGSTVNSNKVTGKFLKLNENVASTGYYDSGVNFSTGQYTKTSSIYVNGLFQATGQITGLKNITINDNSGYFDFNYITGEPENIFRIDGNTGMMNESAHSEFTGYYGNYIPTGLKEKQYNINPENLTGIFSGISYIKTFTGEYNIFVSYENNFTGNGKNFYDLGYTGVYNTTGIKYLSTEPITGNGNLFIFLDKIRGFQSDNLFLEISGTNFYTGISVNT